QYAILKMDWTRLFSVHSHLKNNSIFSLFAPKEVENPFTSRLLLWQTMAKDEQLNLLIGMIREKVAHTLKLDLGHIEPHARLNKLGIDSLMGMELQHSLEAQLGIKIPAMELLRGPSIAELSSTIQKLYASHTR